MDGSHSNENNSEKLINRNKLSSPAIGSSSVNATEQSKLRDSLISINGTKVIRKMILLDPDKLRQFGLDMKIKKAVGSQRTESPESSTSANRTIKLVQKAKVTSALSSKCAEKIPEKSINLTVLQQQISKKLKMNWTTSSSSVDQSSKTPQLIKHSEMSDNMNNSNGGISPCNIRIVKLIPKANDQRIGKVVQDIDNNFKGWSDDKKDLVGKVPNNNINTGSPISGYTAKRLSDVIKSKSSSVAKFDHGYKKLDDITAKGETITSGPEVRTLTQINPKLATPKYGVKVLDDITIKKRSIISSPEASTHTSNTSHKLAIPKYDHGVKMIDDITVKNRLVNSPEAKTQISYRLPTRKIDNGVKVFDQVTLKNETIVGSPEAKTLAQTGNRLSSKPVEVVKTGNGNNTFTIQSTIVDRTRPPAIVYDIDSIPTCSRELIDVRRPNYTRFSNEVKSPNQFNQSGEFRTSKGYDSSAEFTKIPSRDVRGNSGGNKPKLWGRFNKFKKRNKKLQMENEELKSRLYSLMENMNKINSTNQFSLPVEQNGTENYLMPGKANPVKAEATNLMSQIKYSPRKNVDKVSTISKEVPQVLNISVNDKVVAPKKVQMDKPLSISAIPIGENKTGRLRNKSKRPTVASNHKITKYFSQELAKPDFKESTEIDVNKNNLFSNKSVMIEQNDSSPRGPVISFHHDSEILVPEMAEELEISDVDQIIFVEDSNEIVTLEDDINPTIVYDEFGVDDAQGDFDLEMNISNNSSVEHDYSLREDVNKFEKGSNNSTIRDPSKLEKTHIMNISKINHSINILENRLLAVGREAMVTKPPMIHAYPNIEMAESVISHNENIINMKSSELPTSIQMNSSKFRKEKSIGSLNVFEIATQELPVIVSTESFEEEFIKAPSYSHVKISTNSLKHITGYNVQSTITSIANCDNNVPTINDKIQIRREGEKSSETLNNKVLLAEVITKDSKSKKKKSNGTSNILELEVIKNEPPLTMATGSSEGAAIEAIKEEYNVPITTSSLANVTDASYSNNDLPIHQETQARETLITGLVAESNESLIKQNKLKPAREESIILVSNSLLPSSIEPHSEAPFHKIGAPTLLNSNKQIKLREACIEDVAESFKPIRTYLSNKKGKPNSPKLGDKQSNEVFVTTDLRPTIRIQDPRLVTKSEPQHQSNKLGSPNISETSITLSNTNQDIRITQDMPLVVDTDYCDDIFIEPPPYSPIVPMEVSSNTFKITHPVSNFSNTMHEKSARMEPTVNSEELLETKVIVPISSTPLKYSCEASLHKAGELQNSWHKSESRNLPFDNLVETVKPVRTYVNNKILRNCNQEATKISEVSITKTIQDRGPGLHDTLTTKSNSECNQEEGCFEIIKEPPTKPIYDPSPEILDTSINKSKRQRKPKIFWSSETKTSDGQHRQTPDTSILKSKRQSKPKKNSLSEVIETSKQDSNETTNEMSLINNLSPGTPDLSTKSKHLNQPKPKTLSCEVAETIQINSPATVEVSLTETILHQRVETADTSIIKSKRQRKSNRFSLSEVIKTPKQDSKETNKVSFPKILNNLNTEALDSITKSKRQLKLESISSDEVIEIPVGDLDDLIKVPHDPGPEIVDTIITKSNRQRKPKKMSSSEVTEDSNKTVVGPLTTITHDQSSETPNTPAIKCKRQRKQKTNSSSVFTGTPDKDSTEAIDIHKKTVLNLSSETLDTSTIKCKRQRKPKKIASSSDVSETPETISNERIEVSLTEAHSVISEISDTSITKCNRQRKPKSISSSDGTETASSKGKQGRSRKNISPTTNCDISSTTITQTLMGKRGRKPRVKSITRKKLKLEKEEISVSDEDEFLGFPDNTDMPVPMQEQLVEIKREPKSDSKIDYTKKPKTQVSKTVTCGNCKESMGTKLWKAHLRKHNGLGFREGLDEPFDFTEYRIALSVMINYMKTHKLTHIACEQCGTIRKSAIGMLNHGNICGLSVEEQRVPCEHCGKRLLSTGLQYHMQNSCAVLKEEEYNQMMTKKMEAESEPEILEEEMPTDDSKGRSKRKSVRAAERKIKNFIAMIDDVNMENHYIEKKPKIISGGTKRGWTCQLQNSGTIKCRNTSCDYTTDSVQQMLHHAIICRNTDEVYGFHCRYCKFYSSTRDTVIEHIKKEHGNSLKSINNLEFNSGSEASTGEESSESDGSSGEDENEDVPGSDDDDGILDDEYGNERTRIRSSVSGSEYKTTETAEALLRNYSAVIKHPHMTSNFYSLAFRWTVDFIEKHYSCTPLYVTFRPSIVGYIKESDANDYIPVSKTSPKYFFCKENVYEADFGKSATKVCSEDWAQLNLFKGQHYQNHNMILYCGGPILCLDWATFPASYEDNQYLAISCYQDYNDSTKINELQPKKGLIQVWNLGTLSVKQDPIMRYAFKVDFGPVCDLKFCPSGGYVLEERIGLLAVTSLIGDVYIYSLPYNIDEQEDTNIIELQPSVTLRPCLNGNVECRQAYRLTWTKDSEHSIIACGYTNGWVAVWDLKTESKLLRKIINGRPVIIPTKLFHPFPTTINGIEIFHVNKSQWLMVAADKNVKLFDLRTYAHPYEVSTVYQKSSITCSAWSVHWPGYLLGLNESYCLLRNSITLTQPHEIGYKNYPMQSYDATVTDISVSDFLNAYIAVTDSGDIISYLPRDLLLNISRKLNRRLKLILGFTDAIVFDTEQAEDIASKFGIVFCDPAEPILSSHSDLKSKRHRRWSLEQYPIVTLTRIKFNPNKNFHKYYALGMQAGFVRIRYMVPRRRC